MRKNTLTIILVVLSVSVYAQTATEIQDNSSFFDRVYLGGNLGLQLGNVINVQIAPLAGYRITNDLSAGVGIQYQYIKYRTYVPELSTNNYGASIFARHQIRVPLFVQAEYEYLNYAISISSSDKLRDSISSLFIGGGISQPIGANAAFTLIALYNLSYDATNLTSPYNSPLKISGGINLGF